MKDCYKFLLVAFCLRKGSSACKVSTWIIYWSGTMIFLHVLSLAIGQTEGLTFKSKTYMTKNYMGEVIRG